MLRVLSVVQQPEAIDFKCVGLDNIRDFEPPGPIEDLRLVTIKYMEFLFNIIFVVLDSELGRNEMEWTMDELLDYSNYPLKEWDFKLN